MALFTITKPGIYFDVPTDAYFADPCPSPSLTQSIAKVLIAKSPIHAFSEHPRLCPPAADADEEPEKYVVAQAIGNAAHKLIIGRGKDIAVADFDSWRGKTASEFKLDALDNGRVPILTAHMARAYVMADRLRAQLARHEDADAFMHGKGEVVIAWQEGDLWFRCMLDWLHDDHLTVDDLKTTALSAAPHAVGNMAEAAGWDIQAAMIERGLDVLDPHSAGRRKYRFVALENYEPHAASVVHMTEDWLTMGRKKLDYAVEIWRSCLEGNVWPGYPLTAIKPAYPSWAEQRWLQREIHEAAEARVPRKAAPMLTDLSGG